MKRVATIAAGLLLLAGSLVACDPWPYTNSADPFRCEHACEPDQKCQEGKCVPLYDWDKVVLDFYKGTYCPKFLQCNAAHFRTLYRNIDACGKANAAVMSAFRGAPGFIEQANKLKKCLDSSAPLIATCDDFIVTMARKRLLRNCKLGTLKNTKSCAMSFQCKSSNCRVTLPDDECGVCDDLGLNGDSCMDTSSCAGDLICSAGICTKPVAKGSDCSNDPCPLPQVCVSNICTEPKNIGAACATSRECLSHHICNPSTLKCELPSFAGIGKMCGVLKDVWSTYCEHGSLCSLAGKCTGPLASGAACTANPPLGDTQCARPGQICIQGTCKGRIPKLCTSTWTSVSGKPQPITTAPHNWSYSSEKLVDYELGPDFGTLHKGQPTGHIKSRTPGTGNFGALGQAILAATYQGKRVRMSGWVRSKNITGWGGLWMRLDSVVGKFVAMDNMHTRPIKGTKDFTRYDIVMDIAADVHEIVYGVLLDSEGELWIGNTIFEVVDNSVPVTN